jgi:hypothetical protein
LAQLEGQWVSVVDDTVMVGQQPAVARDSYEILITTSGGISTASYLQVASLLYPDGRTAETARINATLRLTNSGEVFSGAVISGPIEASGKSQRPWAAARITPTSANSFVLNVILDSSRYVRPPVSFQRASVQSTSALVPAVEQASPASSNEQSDTATEDSQNSLKTWMETLNTIVDTLKDTGTPGQFQDLQRRLASGQQPSNAELATMLESLIGQFRSDPALASMASILDDSLKDLKKLSSTQRPPTPGRSVTNTSQTPPRMIPTRQTSPARGPNHPPTIDVALLSPTIVSIQSTFQLSFTVHDVDEDLLSWFVSCPNANVVASTTGNTRGMGEGQIASYAGNPVETVPSGTHVMITLRPWIGFRDVLKLNQRSDAQSCTIDAADSKGSSAHLEFPWCALRQQ